MDTSNRGLLVFLLAGLALAGVLVFREPPKRPAAAAPAAGGAKRRSPAAKAPASAPVETRQVEHVAAIETAHFVAEVSNLSAGLKHFTLKDTRYRVGVPIDIVTTDKPRYYPLAVELDGIGIAADAAWRIEQATASGVRLARAVDGITLVRKVEAGATPYQLWLTTRIHNASATQRTLRLHVPTYHYVALASERKGVALLPSQSSAISHALCKHGDELERDARDELIEDAALGDGFKGRERRGRVAFAGVENTYFLNAIALESEAAGACRLGASERGRDASGKTIGTLFSARVSHAEVTLAPGRSIQYRALAYLGPKVPRDLAAAGHSLGESIQTGWFTGLAVGLTWLLRWFHEFLGNWGIAIIVLTFVVKTVLFPLTWKQIQSMAKMKALKPEIDRINELYPDDREKKGAAMMELYRKKGINPMAGCFPVLLQLPIWFSLYQSLASNVELFHAPFALWWQDLSGPDPYFVLPLALGALMFVQQKITPATGMDPVQAKMMLYFMPAMITAFMLFLPAGLCLYMFTNSALSIAQQRVIEARVKRTQAEGEVAVVAGSLAGPHASPDEDPAGAGQSDSKRRSRRGRT